MKRWIAFLMILALLLTGCIGCKKTTDEDASVGEVVEDQNETQSGSKPQKKPEDQYQNLPSAGEDETPEQGESVTPDEDEPGQSDEELPSDEKQEEVIIPDTQQPGEEKDEEITDQPSVDESATNTPSTDLPEVEYPEEEYPEDEEYLEDEEYPEEDEEEEQTPVQTPQTPTATPTPQDPVVTVPSKIKVASYNIKALLYGVDTDGIIQELKDIDADIVGLQEVDKNTNRSKVSGVKVHQVEMLAEKLGYPYWSFDKLIDHSGGEYGMAILSRFPITKSTVVQYDAQQSTDHVRKYGRHELQVGDKKLVFYNTHLCIGDSNDSVSKAQLGQLLDQMKNDTYAVLTGDLNMTAVTAATVVKNYSNLTLLNDGTSTGMLGSKKAAQYIDNIAVTNTLKYTWNATVGTGLEVNETQYSDHNLIYAYVSFK